MKKCPGKTGTPVVCKSAFKLLVKDGKYIGKDGTVDTDTDDIGCEASPDG